MNDVNLRDFTIGYMNQACYKHTGLKLVYSDQWSAAVAYLDRPIGAKIVCEWESLGGIQRQSPMKVWGEVQQSELNT